jgi:hypothetical protein
MRLNAKSSVPFLTIIVLLAGFVAVASGVSRWPVGILWSLAWTSIGWVVGFIFSLSRTKQSESRAETYTQLVNTNLEQISDWLTKILVGLGLTQLREIPTKLQAAAAYVAQGISCPQNPNQALAVGLILYFSVVGFLASYLITRLYINSWLRQVERPERLLEPQTFDATFGNISATEVPEGGAHDGNTASRN